MKTIITSDIHGCSLEFQGLLRLTQLDRDEDTLVVLGDLFDRGRHSYEVFRQILKLREEMGDRFIFVRGNHDQFLLDHVRGGQGLSLWAYNGGLKTVESFKAHDADLEEAAVFIEQSPLYVVTEQFIGVHAGLVSENPEENDPEILLWDRSVAGGAYRGRFAIGGHTPMKEPVLFLNDGTPLVLPYDHPMLLPKEGFMILDTGCVFGGKLTAMVIEEDAYYLRQMKKRDY